MTEDLEALQATLRRLTASKDADAERLHKHLLDMLGVDSHESAAAEIGRLHALTLEKEQPAEAVAPSTWSNYVADMIGAYLKWPVGDARIVAVAGIIERRRKFDPERAAPTAAPSAQPVAVPAEPLVRFCPGCGSVGEVGPEFRDCCPDGSHARMVPKSLAHRCHDLFQLALCAPSDPDEVLAAAPSAPQKGDAA